MQFATAWMDLESIMLNKFSKKKRDRHPMISNIVDVNKVRE